MNRRELLKRGFELGAAGLLLPMVEPIRRYWSLDRTMVAKAAFLQSTGPNCFPGKIVIGDYTVDVDETSEFPFSIGPLKGDLFLATAISSTEWIITDYAASS